MKPHGYWVVMMAEERHATLRNAAEQEHRLRLAGITQPLSQRIGDWLRRWWMHPRVGRSRRYHEESSPALLRELPDKF
jgi:hypothetical protein